MNLEIKIFRSIRNPNFNATCIKDKEVVDKELTRLENLFAQLQELEGYKKAKSNYYDLQQQLKSAEHKIDQARVEKRDVKYRDECIKQYLKIGKRLKKAEKVWDTYLRIQNVIINRKSAIYIEFSQRPLPKKDTVAKDKLSLSNSTIKQDTSSKIASKELAN